jgi:hypothetical protein
LSTEVEPRAQKSPTPPKEFSGDNSFTEHDAEMLMEYYDDILNIDETRIIAAWQRWAEVVRLPHQKLD